MATHRIGTREEWLKARLNLLEAEKELTRRSDELAQQRQALPWVPIEKDYGFDTEDGSEEHRRRRHEREAYPAAQARIHRP